MGVSLILVVFAIYHWYSKVTVWMLNDTMGRIHFVHAPSAPTRSICRCTIRILGVPRRYYALGDTYFILDSAHTMNEGDQHCGVLCRGRAAPVPFNLIWSSANGKHAGGNPWRATTLEWFTPARRRGTATGARSCRSCTAGPMSTACRVSRTTSCRRTSHRRAASRRSFTATVMATDWARQGSRARAGPRHGRSPHVSLTVAFAGILAGVIVWWLAVRRLTTRPWEAQGTGRARFRGHAVRHRRASSWILLAILTSLRSSSPATGCAWATVRAGSRTTGIHSPSRACSGSTRAASRSAASRCSGAWRRTAMTAPCAARVAARRARSRSWSGSTTRRQLQARGTTRPSIPRTLPSTC